MVENLRSIAKLSTAGIAFMAALVIFGPFHGGWRMPVAALAFLGFFIALVKSLCALEKNADILADSVKTGSDRPLVLETTGKMAKKFFIFGCLCMLVVALIIGHGRAMKNCPFAVKGCPMKAMMSGQKSEAGAKASASAASEAKAAVKESKLAEASTAPGVSASSESSNSTAATSAMASPKPAGNGGNFKSGKIY
jgi:hypothetical protein